MVGTVALIALLLLMAVVATAIFRRLPVPDSVVLVIAGVALGEAARHWPPLTPAADLRLSPELVFFVLLPVLVFESGLNLDTRRLVKNLVPVVTLAVPALILSTIVIGLGLWLTLGVDLLVALLFGALISATDPVAVVALFREVGAPARLSVLVEGESLFNDATAIVVVGLLLGLLAAGPSPDPGTLGWAVLRFVVVFLGGLACGVAAGVLGSELIHRLEVPLTAIIAVSVAVAYLSFIVAEHGLHVSGVMATVGASITFGALGVMRFTRDAAEVLGETWELLAYVCNALLFVLVGLAVDVVSLARSWPLILVAVVLVHAARAVAVYGFVPLTTRTFRLPAVPMNDRHIMWWGGLKGGLAVAIALSLPESMTQRQLVLDVTVGVVLFTLLVNATTLRALMRRLGLDRLSGEERAEVDEAMADTRRRVEARLDGFRRDGLMSSQVHHRLVHALLRDLAPGASAGASEVAHLAALRAEWESLNALHECHAIDQYAYLELRDLLLHDEEEGAGSPPQRPGGSGNMFLRLEAMALSWLRERDWASGLLTRYQSIRLHQYLQHNLAGVVMAQAALQALAGRDDADSRAVRELVQRYRERARRRRSRLADVRREFPGLFARFEASTFRRAALMGALRDAGHEAQHGQIGAKAAQAVRRRIEQALAKPVAVPRDGADERMLLSRVPLFTGLPTPCLDALAAEVRPVTVLPGDVIIGEGEHGDALYVVSRGRVSITRSGDVSGGGPLAQLVDGDVFGEAAMLGDAVRNATVTAVFPSTLLRITRPQVLAVARTWPELGQRLRRLERSRHDEG